MIRLNCFFQAKAGKYNDALSAALALVAESIGVNSCWLNFFDPDKVAAEFGIPETEQVLMIMDLGFAAEGTGPLQSHFDRKPLEETVTYL
ncbi:MAG: nitroreductase family protein [Bacteroidales bacterium]|nr:nitroreductase family protein [Candidatus Minthousia equi]